MLLISCITSEALHTGLQKHMNQFPVFITQTCYYQFFFHLNIDQITTPMKRNINTQTALHTILLCGSRRIVFNNNSSCFLGKMLDRPIVHDLPTPMRQTDSVNNRRTWWSEMNDSKRMLMLFCACWICNRATVSEQVKK